jgi:hypothetical protein
VANVRSVYLRQADSLSGDKLECVFFQRKGRLACEIESIDELVSTVRYNDACALQPKTQHAYQVTPPIPYPRS